MLRNLRRAGIVRAFALTILFVWLAAAALPLHAANTPYLVKNIRAKGGANPTRLTALNNKLVFQIPKGSDGKPQLWRSDGTRRGTTPIRSFEQFSFSNRSFVAAGKRVYFVADDGAHGFEPWRTNGTPKGTKLVADFKPGAKSSSTNFVNNTDNRAFLMLFPYFQVIQLFCVTNKGLTYAAPLGMLPGGVALGDTFYFAGGTAGSFEIDVWQTNCTTDSTTMLKRINPDGGSYPGSFTLNGDTFWFFATDETGLRGLWQSDGTSDGTQLIRELGDPSLTGIATTANLQGVLYFIMRNGTLNRHELWTSDSTPEGTTMVFDLGTLADGAASPEFAVVGSQLLFPFDDGINGRQLWSSDGTAEGTQMLTTSSQLQHGIAGQLVVVNNIALFSAGDDAHGFELWQSDGTAQGTHMVADINPKPQRGSFPEWLTRVGDTLFFTAQDGAHGRELWAYNPQ